MRLRLFGSRVDVRSSSRHLMRHFAGIMVALVLVASALAVHQPEADAVPPPEPIGQIGMTAGGPGLETNPLAQSEGPSDVAVHGNDVYIVDTTMGVVRDLD